MIDLTSHLSKEAKRREPSKLKAVLKHRTPQMAYLAGGLPLPKYFAWDSISVSTRHAPFEGGIVGEQTQENALDFTVGYGPSEHDIPLGSSLQYGASKGPEQILAFIREHTDLVHRVPYEDYDIITTVGSTHGWDALLRTLCDPGDTILVEQYVFASAVETAKPLGIKMSPIVMDDFGIVPEILEKKLSNWTGALPKLMYLVPTGQNPTGSSLSKERRQKIYEIAVKYQIIIVEDEPYYFLQLDPYSEESAGAKTFKNETDEHFLKSLVPSFLSMDTEGIVIRLDSFSKVLAPGVRLAWIVGQRPIIERLQRQFEVSIQTPSGFTNAIVYGTLSRWGQSGYLDWLKALRHEYSFKRDMTIKACNKFLPKSANVVVPIAGMFFTIRFDCTRHKEFKTKYSEDPLQLENALFESAIKHDSCLVPGSWFEMVDIDGKHSTEIFFRGTYAATDVQTLELGIERFAKAVNEIWV